MLKHWQIHWLEDCERLPLKEDKVTGRNGPSVVISGSAAQLLGLRFSQLNSEHWFSVLKKENITVGNQHTQTIFSGLKAFQCTWWRTQEKELSRKINHFALHHNLDLHLMQGVNSRLVWIAEKQRSGQQFKSFRGLLVFCTRVEGCFFFVFNVNTQTVS